MRYIATIVIDNDELIKGNKCITSLSELFQVLIDKQTQIITLRKDFTDKYFTPSGLYEFVKNAKDVNDRIEIITEDNVDGFEEDFVKQLSKITSTEELIFNIVDKPEKMMNMLKVLCNNYINNYTETLLANNKLSTLHMQLINEQQMREECDIKYSKLLELKQQYSDTLSVILSRINYKYNKDMDSAKQFQIDIELNSYDRILYIKEITRVKFIDTFLYYLAELLKTLYDVPTRFIAIEPYYANKRKKLYPKLKSHLDLSYNDIKQSDIFMAGFQPIVMEAILANPMHVNYLIVLDRGGYELEHLVGDRVEVIYTASDVNDIDKNVPLNRVITYNKETLHIPFKAKFDSMSIEEKIREYADMDAMKAIIALIERKS